MHAPLADLVVQRTDLDVMSMQESPSPTTASHSPLGPHDAAWLVPPQPRSSARLVCSVPSAAKTRTFPTAGMKTSLQNGGFKCYVSARRRVGRV